MRWKKRLDAQKQEKAAEEDVHLEPTIKPEKKDARAMMIAAFVTIFPFVLFMLALLFGLLWLAFGR